MPDLKKYILSQLGNGLITKEEAASLLKEIGTNRGNKHGDIAIIGMACRLPMADSIEEYWDNIINGRCCFIAKPKDKLVFETVLKNPYYAEFMETSVGPNFEDLEGVIGAFISDTDKFDADFFSISPREAKYIDPAQRIFMETAWSAIEDAGYSIGTIRDTMTGVYVGKDYSNSIHYREITTPDPMKVTGTWEGILASRISYAFNFRGPAMVIDTACSSGLVAIHEACNALRNNECEMALAGGLSIGAGGSSRDDKDEEKEKAESSTSTVGAVTSKDNRVRTFDKKCSGSVFGEGITVFLLKPYENAVHDHDNIYAIIKGSAINNDGASNGITAPNPLAQEAVITEAWKRAGVSPESINYIEAHGTGTLLGDPIEIMGLTNAFKKQTAKKQFCGIGSVKTNIGHLVGASGCASLMKVALAMQKGIIPPSINFEEPNKNIDFLNSPVYVIDKSTEWNNENGPRRAGINAFGFNGTNCHMVVEETPTVTEVYRQERKKNIITFSGKTEISLYNLVKAYSDFFEKDRVLDFGDVCYTANVGRGHYSFRMAVVADGIKELLDKLEKLKSNDFSAQNINGVYLGRHKIVSEKYTNISNGEIRERELRYLSVEAQSISCELAGHTDFEDEKLNRLAELYVKGAEVDWSTLYSGEVHYKVSLPTYRFDKVYCWADPKVTKISTGIETTDEEKIHSVVDRKIVSSLNETIYAAKFNIEKHWFLKEHKIMGSNIVPGTTYIEIVKAVCVKYFNSENVIIRELVFVKPLVVEENVEAHIILKREDDGVRFTVASKASEDGDDWIIHAEGSAGIHQCVPTDTFDVTNYAQGGTEISIVIPENETDEMVYMGPRWHSVEHIYQNGDVLQSELRLDSKFLVDMKDYAYHPAIADAALNIPLQVYINHELYLPLSYHNLKIYGKLPAHFYSRLVKKTGGNGSETISFRVTLADENGKILAEIDDYTTKKVAKFNSYVANSYYRLDWQKVVSVIAGEPAKIKGNILVFEDEGGFARKFAEKLNNKKSNYFAYFGDECRKDNSNTYCVDGSEQGYEWLMEQLSIDELDHVFHFSTLDFENEIVPLDKYAETLKKGLYCMFFLPRVMLRHVSGQTAFYMVSENAHEITGNEGVVKPLNNSFLSIAKTLTAEYTNLSVKCLDITKAETADDVYHAITKADDHLITALREGESYVETLSSYNTSKMETEECPLYKDGIYVITGGTGGLGLEIAKYLAEAGAGNICLIARRSVPERERFTEILEKNRNKRVVNIIRSIEMIEDFGATVYLHSADVSNYDEISQVMSELTKEFGVIRGIVHSAGVAGDGFLYNKPVDTFKDVINPKILGIANIVDALGGQKPSFILMFSSMQTAFGGAGQGDYTAGNAFLDSYAGYLTAKGINAKTINWPGWSETGMAVDCGVADAMTLFKSLTTNKALAAFNFVLSHQISNVIPGELSVKFLDKVEMVLPFEISLSIARALKRYRSKNVATGKKEAVRRFNPDELIILGKGAEEYTELEKTIAIIYAGVLDLNEIDIYENFNAMGGDSIIAAEVLKILNAQFDNILSVSDMFTYACVMDMAGHIQENLDEV